MDQDLVEQAIGELLSPKPTLELRPELYLWEKKTWGLHRGLVYLEQDSFSSSRDIEEAVRDVVATEFNLKWEWLRGFAFGACIKAREIPGDLNAIEKCVDIRNRLQGVFQWLIFAADKPPFSFGIHTWTEGYLSPIFRNIAAAIEETETPCHTFVRDKGRFFEFAQKAIALKGARVPEFDHRLETHPGRGSHV